MVTWGPTKFLLVGLDFCGPKYIKWTVYDKLSRSRRTPYDKLSTSFVMAKKESGAGATHTSLRKGSLKA